MTSQSGLFLRTNAVLVVCLGLVKTLTQKVQGFQIPEPKSFSKSYPHPLLSCAAASSDIDSNHRELSSSEKIRHSQVALVTSTFSRHHCHQEEHSRSTDRLRL
jgi:hypothetical protein